MTYDRETYVEALGEIIREDEITCRRLLKHFGEVNDAALAFIENGPALKQAMESTENLDQDELEDTDSDSDTCDQSGLSYNDSDCCDELTKFQNLYLHPLMPENIEDITVALATFKEEFHRRYGDKLNLLTTSLEDAAEAALKDRKPLAVYLHDDHSSSTAGYCADVFRSETVTSYLNKNYLVWGFDMTDENNGQIFKGFLRKNFGPSLVERLEGFSERDFPLIIVLGGNSHITEFLRSSLTLDAFMTKLEDLSELTEAGGEAFERRLPAPECKSGFEDPKSKRLRLKFEQKRACKKSPASKIAKLESQKQQHGRLEAERQEKDTLSGLNTALVGLKIEEWLEEPRADCGEELVLIHFRTISGGQFERFFLASHPVENLVTFVASRGILPGDCKVFAQRSLRCFSDMEKSMTLKQCGFGSVVVVVEKLHSD